MGPCRGEQHLTVISPFSISQLHARLVTAALVICVQCAQRTSLSVGILAARHLEVAQVDPTARPYAPGPPRHLQGGSLPKARSISSPVQAHTGARADTRFTAEQKGSSRPMVLSQRTIWGSLTPRLRRGSGPVVQIVRTGHEIVGEAGSWSQRQSRREHADVCGNRVEPRPVM